MIDYLNGIDYELQRLEKMKDICRKQIDRLPEGNLIKTVQNGSEYYKVVQNGVRSAIKSEDPLVQRLKERRLCSEIENRAAFNIGLLEDVKKQYRNTNPLWCREHLPKSYQDVSDDFLEQLGCLTPRQFRKKFKTDEQYRFSQRLHTTSAGIKVRSRAEVSIVEKYLSKGLIFVYEPIIYLSSNEWLHPDFAVLVQSLNRVRFHEHVGNLANKEYRNYFEWKLDQYSKIGLYPIRDIVFSYEKEDGTLDMTEIEKMIDAYLV